MYKYLYLFCEDLIKKLIMINCNDNWRCILLKMHFVEDAFCWRCILLKMHFVYGKIVPQMKLNFQLESILMYFFQSNLYVLVY